MIPAFDVKKLKLKIFKVSFRNHQLKTCDFCYKTHVSFPKNSCDIDFLSKGKSFLGGLPATHQKESILMECAPRELQVYQAQK